MAMTNLLFVLWVRKGLNIEYSTLKYQGTLMNTCKCKGKSYSEGKKKKKKGERRKEKGERREERGQWRERDRDIARD